MIWAPVNFISVSSLALLKIRLLGISIALTKRSLSRSLFASLIVRLIAPTGGTIIAVESLSGFPIARDLLWEFYRTPYSVA